MQQEVQYGVALLQNKATFPQFALTVPVNGMVFLLPSLIDSCRPNMLKTFRKKPPKKRSVLLTQGEINYLRQCVRTCLAITDYTQRTESYDLRAWGRKFSKQKS